LSQRNPVLSCRFSSRFHQRELPPDLRRPLQLTLLPDSVRHPVGHNFDLFVFVNRRSHPIGLEVRIEVFDMVLHDIRSSLILVLCTTG
jgi:hypothetical protein